MIIAPLLAKAASLCNSQTTASAPWAKSFRASPSVRWIRSKEGMEGVFGFVMPGQLACHNPKYFDKFLGFLGNEENTSGT
jgi:hypothetical protein